MNIDKEPSRVIEDLEIFRPDGLTIPREVLASLAIQNTSTGTPEIPTETAPDSPIGHDAPEDEVVPDVRAKVEELRQKIEDTREAIERQKSA